MTAADEMAISGPVAGVTIGPIEAATRVTLTGAAREMLDTVFPVEEPVEGVPLP